MGFLHRRQVRRLQGGVQVCKTNEGTKTACGSMSPAVTESCSEPLSVPLDVTGDTNSEANAAAGTRRAANGKDMVTEVVDGEKEEMPMGAMDGLLGVLPIN